MITQNQGEERLLLLFLYYCTSKLLHIGDLRLGYGKSQCAAGNSFKFDAPQVAC